jgi:hypothetical protein
VFLLAAFLVGSVLGVSDLPPVANFTSTANCTLLPHRPIPAPNLFPGGFSACSQNSDCASAGPCASPSVCVLGLCSVPMALANYTPCNDANSNTVGDVCMSGVCAGLGALICISFSDWFRACLP